MATGNQIVPGMTINIDKKIYRVESAAKISLTKGNPFIKTKLRDLLTDEVIEKNFKLEAEVSEVTLQEKKLEYLYSEENGYVFLDVDHLDLEKVPMNVLGDKINYIKEGTVIKAMYYGDSVFSIELPQFLELMIVKTASSLEALNVSGSTKKAVLETGAEISVPAFIEIGDVIKVDTHQKEYIQRV